MSETLSKQALVVTAFSRVGWTTHVIAIARFAATFPVLVRAIEIDPEHRLLREPGQTNKTRLMSQLLSQLLSQLHSLRLSVVK